MTLMERAYLPEILKGLVVTNWHFMRNLAINFAHAFGLAKGRRAFATTQYPEDRVVHNDLGRVFFLQHKYLQAKQEFQKTLAIDPEDLEANYHLMLCYTGLGDSRDASRYEKRFLRFKADESSQALTGPYRTKHPDDNRERQPIHEHDSVALPVVATSNSRHGGSVLSRGGGS